MKKRTIAALAGLMAIATCQACLPGEEIPESPPSGGSSVVGPDTDEEPDGSEDQDEPDHGEEAGAFSTIFTPGEGGYAFFRIPAAVTADDGSILVFAEGRVDNSEDYGNIDIVLKRSSDRGKTWGDLILVKDDAENTCGNPAPVVLGNGRVLLVYNLAIPDRLNEVDDVTYVTWSDDGGLTWSESMNISDQIKSDGESNFHPGPVHGIVKQYEPCKGRIIIPVWGSNPKAFIIYSDDGGVTWHKGAKMDYQYANESTVAELCDGKLIFNTRDGNKQEGAYFRYDAISEDGGETFLPSRRTSLVEPVNGCQGSMISYGKDEKTGQTILLFCNPNHTSSRRHGAVRASFDSGRSWTKMYQFVPSEGDDMYVSYSDMVMEGDGRIGVIYETGYKNSKGIVYKKVFFSDIKDPVKYQ